MKKKDLKNLILAEHTEGNMVNCYELLKLINMFKMDGRARSGKESKKTHIAKICKGQVM